MSIIANISNNKTLPYLILCFIISVTEYSSFLYIRKSYYNTYRLEFYVFQCKPTPLIIFNQIFQIGLTPSCYLLLLSLGSYNYIALFLLFCILPNFTYCKILFDPETALSLTRAPHIIALLGFSAKLVTPKIL